MSSPQHIKPTPPFTKTGRVPFKVPNTDINAETWFVVYGDLTSNITPLICLHGGPGMAHNYLLPCAHLSSSPHTRPVILYDQLGCGNSTHLPEKKGDGSFWTPELFLAELENLISFLNLQSYDVLGQSWGGMLAAQHATKNPSGLRRLVICNSPAEMTTWVEVADQLRKRLPPHVQETLTRCEREGKTSSDEYEAAVMVFYQRHVCRVVPFPKEFQETLDQLKKDDTVYLTMNGPSEFYVCGSLRTWDLTSQLHKIKTPTLLINGKHDEAQDIVMEPYFRDIDAKVKWVRFADSSHCPHLEERNEFIEAVENFLHAET